MDGPTPPNFNLSPLMEPLRSTTKHNAVPGVTQSRTENIPALPKWVARAGASAIRLAAIAAKVCAPFAKADRRSGTKELNPCVCTAFSAQRLCWP